MIADMRLFRFSGRLAAMIFLLFAGQGHASEDASVGSIRILVYGASGKVGTQVVSEALQRGHLVTAVSRDPSRITRVHDNLSAVRGDVLDEASVQELVADQDVVIISVRGVVGDSGDPRETVAYMAVENMVDALRGQGDGAARLIHVGGSGSLEVKPGVIYAETMPTAFMPRKLEIEISGQVLALEYLRTVTDVRWSFATPAKYFTNGKRTGEFRIGGDQMMKDKKGRSSISRADFAVAIIDEAENAKHVGRRFSVAY
jgi:putative NADH-flavin reductase